MPRRIAVRRNEPGQKICYGEDTADDLQHGDVRALAPAGRQNHRMGALSGVGLHDHPATSTDRRQFGEPHEPAINTGSSPRGHFQNLDPGPHVIEIATRLVAIEFHGVGQIALRDHGEISRVEDGRVLQAACLRLP